MQGQEGHQHRQRHHLLPRVQLGQHLDKTPQWKLTIGGFWQTNFLLGKPPEPTSMIGKRAVFVIHAKLMMVDALAGSQFFFSTHALKSFQPIPLLFRQGKAGFSPSESSLKCTAATLTPSTFKCNPNACALPSVNKAQGNGCSGVSGGMIDSGSKCQAGAARTEAVPKGEAFAWLWFSGNSPLNC